MNAKGSFEVEVKHEPPHEVVDGVALARAHVNKRFFGPLDATSTVEMLTVKTPVQGWAAYVAFERVTGTLDGKHGSFVLQHVAGMEGGKPSLAVTVVPDSGTGELRGISGVVNIRIDEEGRHFYDFEYELEG